MSYEDVLDRLNTINVFGFLVIIVEYVIGSDGFGFIKINGNNTKIDQIGHVVIEDNVEIGGHTTVDRGTIGNTVIKKYTKIDNF